VGLGRNSPKAVTGAPTPADLPQNTMATNATPAEGTTVSVDGHPDDLDERDVRALTEKMTVIDYNEHGPDMYGVVSGSGNHYTVDTRHDSCDCPDARHRDVHCKHQRRVAFATGERPIPAWVSMDAVDPLLGEQVSGPRIATTDGGLFREGEPGPDVETERVDGGVLVWDAGGDGVGRELLGFADVTDESALRRELAARGLGVGALAHKERFEASEVGLDE